MQFQHTCKNHQEKLLWLVLPDKFDRYLLQNSTGAFYVWVKALRGRPLNF